MEYIVLKVHTACWDAVGCEWGTTSVYFVSTYVCFIPRKAPVFAVEPRYQHRFFICVKNIIWMTKNPNFQKIYLGLKSFFIPCFLQLPLWYPLGSNLCKHGDGYSVTIEACTSLAGVCVVWRSGSSLELAALWQNRPICRRYFQSHILIWNSLILVWIHWNLFPIVNSTTNHHWFRTRAEQTTNHYLNQRWLGILTHLCVTRSASMGLLLCDCIVSMDVVSFERQIH